jgi:2-keto-4-pentenoate hydratase/2-oxohepta-3-ene-1,7-dioic acid hydratase in catechol pathway
MRICRFDDNRLGVVRGAEVLDVTPALNEIPAQRWPLAPGDPLVANWSRVAPAIAALLPAAPKKPLARVKLLAPVPNPTKIINAPINYSDHVEEAKKDTLMSSGRSITHISDWGLFLKANSALAGFGEGVSLRFPDGRNDFECELAVVIGRTATRVAAADALSYVFGYAIGLDMTLRGKQLQCWRKSIDTYAVCGPWVVTADEVPDPNVLDLKLFQNGELRQDSNTRYLVYNVNQLIEYATTMYTLHPGDLIFTGTPAGVGPVQPGDVLKPFIQRVCEGEVEVRIASAYVT